jgi:peptidoglycan L-alanyl-D-glutamate endopeptidase CwlK
MMNKLIVGSVVRHLIGWVGAWVTLKYGINLDAGTINSVTELVLGLIMSGGALYAGAVEKTERTVTTPFSLKDNPIVDVESTKEAPKGFFLSERSLNNMKGVDSNLVGVIKDAIVNSPYDFVVIEGLRSTERQAEMLRTGKSKIKRSTHQDGLAVDIMCYDENGNGTWEHKYYNAVAEHIKNIASAKSVDVEWGGDWQRFVDAVHFQINK